MKKVSVQFNMQIEDGTNHEELENTIRKGLNFAHLMSLEINNIEVNKEGSENE